MIFRKMLLNKKCVMILSTKVVYNISHSKKNLVKYYNKYTYAFM